ncbi:kinase-like domain-containing protein, partial [Baffinella frigidus]
KPGRQRWKFTHRGVVYITNHSTAKEIFSWRIVETENIIPVVASDAETGTHVVLVVDASGSMRKCDVSGYPSRTYAVYDCLVKDFLKLQLQLLAGRGGAESSTNVTLIEMSDAATVIFEREPIHARLGEKFRERMLSTARNHGNYLPALERSGEVLLRDRETNRQLFLLFLSDGAPSDHVGKECPHGIKVWTQDGNRLDARGHPKLLVCPWGGPACRNAVQNECEEKCLNEIVKIGDILGRDRTFIGTEPPLSFGPPSEEFQTLRDMAGVLPKNRFHKGGLSSGFLNTAFSSLSTSLTSLRTEAPSPTLFSYSFVCGNKEEEEEDYGGRNARSRAFISKTRWEPAARRFVAVPLTHGATGIAHANASFAQGAERLAWHCTEVDTQLRPVGTKLVAKMTKHENFLQDTDFHTSFCKVQRKAQEYTGFFNRRRRRRRAGHLPGRHPPPDGLNAIGEDDEEEEDGQAAGGVRAAGRLGGVDVEDVPQAFSHFTFELSGGRELVCDLQGTWNAVHGYVLTDPVIHTERGREGRTDKGKEGMRRFFETHTYSDLCRILSLRPSAALLAGHAALGPVSSPLSLFPRLRVTPFLRQVSPHGGSQSYEEMVRYLQGLGFED